MLIPMAQGLIGHTAERHWRPGGRGGFPPSSGLGLIGHTAERHWRRAPLQRIHFLAVVGPHRPHSRKALETHNWFGWGLDGGKFGLIGHTAERHWRLVIARDQTPPAEARPHRPHSRKALETSYEFHLRRMMRIGLIGHTAERHWRPCPLQPTFLEMRFGLIGHTAERHWRLVWPKYKGRAGLPRPHRPHSRKALETRSDSSARLTTGAVAS